MRTVLKAAIALGAMTLPGAAFAETVEVVVSGVKSDKGEIRCALFASADGFPMGVAKARVVGQPARRSGVSCRFDNVAPGNYAVAVSHDLNGNKRTDANILGIPREDWGVSKGARPSMRAPRFTEAQFKVANDPIRIDVKVAR